ARSRLLLAATCKLVFFYRLVHHHSQVAPHGVDYRRQPLRRSVDKEEQLRENLLPRWHRGQRFNLAHLDHTAFNHAGLEGELWVFLGVLAERLRQRYGIVAISNRGNATQALERLSRRRALG